MHPASENALNTDTPKPKLQPEDGTPAAKAAAAGGADGRTGADPLPLPEEQSARPEHMSGAAPEKTPQTVDPLQTADDARQDGAEQTDATDRSGGQPAEQEDAPPAHSVLMDAPTLEQLEKELKKERRRIDFGRVLRNTLFSLIVVASVSALIAVLLLPVLQIHGSSMSPTLNDQDIVAAISIGKCKEGDLIAFYYNNNILIKRVIAGPGDWVDIDGEGNVSVNGQLLEEPYLTEKARGNCDITFPYQVPDARYFVMGDHRATSVDSRNEVVGCVSREMVIGRIFIRVWPMETIRLF